MVDFTITEEARLRIEQILRSKSIKDEISRDKSLFVRLEVLGGGCSGLKYNFDITDKKERDDYSFEAEGTNLLIDSDSLTFLDGAALDYKKELIGAAFEVKNPNSVSSCGCGLSFSI